MIVLPIKKKWFDMISSGEKKEEYREIKRYWDIRFLKAIGFSESEFKDAKELLKKQECSKGIIVTFRNGYSFESPEIVARCFLSIGEGKAEWGAELGKEYYVLRIERILEG